jgi:hypothetical protein
MCHNLDLRFRPFITFCQVFSLPLFRFFDLAFYCLFYFFLFDFLSPFIFPFFFALILYLFFSHVVSSLAYPNLVGNKRLGCCAESQLIYKLFLPCVCRIRYDSIFGAQLFGHYDES